MVPNSNDVVLCDEGGLLLDFANFKFNTTVDCLLYNTSISVMTHQRRNCKTYETDNHGSIHDIKL